MMATIELHAGGEVHRGGICQLHCNWGMIITHLILKRDTMSQPVRCNLKFDGQEARPEIFGSHR